MAGVHAPELGGSAQGTALLGGCAASTYLDLGQGARIGSVDGQGARRHLIGAGRGGRGQPAGVKGNGYDPCMQSTAPWIGSLDHWILGAVNGSMAAGPVIDPVAATLDPGLVLQAASALREGEERPGDCN